MGQDHAPGLGAFEHELSLVEGALALVGSGAAPSVTLVGLNGGPALVRLALDLGQRVGVSVHARTHGAHDRPDDVRFDLVVEKDG